MSRFGELLGGKKVAPAMVAGVNKLIEKSSKEIVSETVVEEVVEEKIVEEVFNGVDIDFHSMSKRELESYGRTVGIELDRRHSKTTLIRELEEHIANS